MKEVVNNLSPIAAKALIAAGGMVGGFLYGKLVDTLGLDPTRNWQDNVQKTMIIGAGIMSGAGFANMVIGATGESTVFDEFRRGTAIALIGTAMCYTSARVMQLQQQQENAARGR